MGTAKRRSVSALSQQNGHSLPAKLVEGCSCLTNHDQNPSRDTWCMTCFVPALFQGLIIWEFASHCLWKKNKDLYDVTHPDSPFLASHAQKAAFVWPSSCEVQPTMHLVLAARVSFSAFLQEVAPSHLIGEKSNVALTTKKWHIGVDDSGLSQSCHVEMLRCVSCTDRLAKMSWADRNGMISNSS